MVGPFHCADQVPGILCWVASLSYLGPEAGSFLLVARMRSAWRAGVVAGNLWREVHMLRTSNDGGPVLSCEAVGTPWMEEHMKWSDGEQQ